MKIDVIGVVLSLVFILLNVWRDYTEDKPVSSEPFVFAV